jgi:hypothetical protein
MGLQPTSGAPKSDVPRIVSVPVSSAPLCAVCNQPVPLELAKTDEAGRAIHDECYLQRVSSPS